MAERDEQRDKKPRDHKPRDNKPRDDQPRGHKPESGGRPGAARNSGAAGRGGYKRDDYRPPKRDGGPPSYEKRPRPAGSDRPRTEYSDRPRREYNDRPRPEYSDRPRPAYNDRPRSAYNDRPRPAYNDRPRPEYPDRPRREYSDRPKRDYVERPRRDEHAPASNDRPRRQYDQPRPYEGRAYPARPYAPRPQRGARPQYAPHHETRVEREQYVEDGEELICGRRPVEEAFAARRDAVRLLIVPERRAALDALAIHATTLRIPVVEVEGGTLTALAGFDGHQGVALVAKQRPAGDVDSILARARERNEPPFVLVLDSLEDPQNFGTLLRSAEAAGVHGVIYPTRRSAPLSPAAIKASAGATEHLVLAAVDDLAGTLADLHGDGLRIVGADEEASLSFTDADLRGPLAVVVGSEGQGISGSVRRRLDLVLRIPMRGKIESLNAAVAGSILLFAAAGQRPEPQSAASATKRMESEASEESVQQADAEPEVADRNEIGASEDGLLPGDS